MIARKIMLLGEIGVGKSSLARRLVFDRFEFDYKPTIGVDIFRYEVEPTPARGAMSFIIWDTDGNFGQAIFRHIYMKEASAALIVGDMTRPQTLDTMLALGTGFMAEFPGRVLTYVVNKTDLVTDPEAAPLPPQLAAPSSRLIKTSAKNGINVARAFIETADVIARRGH